MNLHHLTLPSALTVILALAGCSQAPDPSQDDSDLEADDGTRTPSEDEISPADEERENDEDDLSREDDERSGDQPPANNVRDAGSTHDAGGRASTRDAEASSRDAATPSAEPGAELDFASLFDDGGLLAPKIPGPPSPDNPKECPPVAPDNPIGPCIGVPVYATCTYGTYACLCDWVHWLCI